MLPAGKGVDAEQQTAAHHKVWEWGLKLSILTNFPKDSVYVGKQLLSRQLKSQQGL